MYNVFSLTTKTTYCIFKAAMVIYGWIRRIPHEFLHSEGGVCGGGWGVGSVLNCNCEDDPLGNFQVLNILVCRLTQGTPWAFSRNASVHACC